MEPSHIEFGCAFVTDSEGNCRYRDDVNAPEFASTYADENGKEVFEFDVDGWDPVSGLTGQYNYNGPMMHPSEFLTDANMKRLYEEDGENTFAYLMIRDEDHSKKCDKEEHDECEEFLDEWMLVRKVSNN